MAGIVYRNRFPKAVLADLKEVGQHGRVPDERALGHPHGWGVVSFKDEKPLYIARRTDPIFQDPLFKTVPSALDELAPPNIVIAHVRHASKGIVKEENTHPFVVGSIVLVHNGTVEGLTSTASRKPKGETDSEILALTLADLYEEKRDLRSAMKSLVKETIQPRSFTAAVILASDGAALAGYRDYSKNGNYYDLRIASSTDSVILFQEGLSGYASSSEQVAKGELVSVGLDLEIRRELLA